MKKMIVLLSALLIIICISAVPVFADEFDGFVFDTPQKHIVVSATNPDAQINLDVSLKDGIGIDTVDYRFSAEASKDGANYVQDFNAVSTEEIDGFLIDTKNQTIGVFVITDVNNDIVTKITNIITEKYDMYMTDASIGDKKCRVRLYVSKEANSGIDSIVAPIAQTAVKATSDEAVIETVAPTTASTEDMGTVSKGATGDSVNKLSSEVQTAAGAPAVMYIVLGASVVLALAGMFIYKKNVN